MICKHGKTSLAEDSDDTEKSQEMVLSSKYQTLEEVRTHEISKLSHYIMNIQTNEKMASVNKKALEGKIKRSLKMSFEKVERVAKEEVEKKQI